MTDKLQHHEIIVEWLEDEQGRAIMLTQPDNSGCNESPSILLSPWQLREVCEKFDPNGTSDPQAAKTIATFTRRLLLLNDRIEHLADYLSNHSDHKHADLKYEMTYADATADIAAEFVADMEGAHIGTEPPKRAPERDKPQTTTDPRRLSTDA
jgi:hypothetical protein